MSTANQLLPISIDEYLAGELQARQRHEYVEGIVYATVGGTNAHNIIATNATVALGSQLRGRPCRVFNSDTKVRVCLARGTRFYYPDAMVVCHFNAPSDTFQDAPVVIVEVISKSTRRTDENEKREAYFAIDSLCVYILVEQSSMAAVVYRRTNSGFDRKLYQGADAVIDLPEVGCQLPLRDLYEDAGLQAEAMEVEADPT